MPFYDDEALSGDKLRYELERFRMRNYSSGGSSATLANATQPRKKNDEAGMTAVRLSFQGNTIKVSRFRTREDNLAFAKSALSLILEYDPFVGRLGSPPEFETYGGKVEYYKLGN